VVERVAARVGERVIRIIREYDAAAVEEVFSDGLLNVMEAPEFAQSDKLRQVFSALENRAFLGELVGSVADSGRIHIVIGAENPRAEMHGVSLVLAPYGRPGRAIGVVGVLGPTRMSYPQAIGTVRFVSGLMNELVDHLYA
jgi:heat-inducible transcriptional repressor